MTPGRGGAGRSALVGLLAVLVVAVGACAGTTEEAGGDPADARADGSAAPAAPGTTEAMAPITGADVSYDVVTEVRTWVDGTRTTPEAGREPAEDVRALETYLWYPEGDGPFPLIAFAHGFAGHPERFSELLSWWAAHGYVVAAPRFPRTSSDSPDNVEGLPDLASQPGDVSFVIDRVLAASAPGGDLEGLVDGERIGAAGLSYGGGTTYGLVYNSCCRDDRIDAAEVLAGFDFPFPGTYDLSVGPPLLIVHGTADPALAYDEAVRVAEGAGVPTWFVTLVDGLHAQPFQDDPSPFDRQVEALTLDFWDEHLAGRTDRVGAIEASADVPGLIELQVLGG